MFEATEVGHKTPKAEYEQRMPELRMELIQAQLAARQSDFAAIALFAGNDKAGCRAMVNRLHEWLDPRGLEASAFGTPTPEELERPRFWRYWRALPARQRLGTFTTAWTMRAAIRRINNEINDDEYERSLQRIRRFEQMLVDDGALLMKFWLHLPKPAMKMLLKKAEKNPDKYWQVTETDHKIYKAYDRSIPIYERAIRITSTGWAPWHLIESTDSHYRDLAVAEKLLESLNQRVDHPEPPPTAVTAAKVEADAHTILDTVDLSHKLELESYEKQLPRWQAKLSRLSRRATEKGVCSVLVFEGWDAAGKGGTIRRLIMPMNAEYYRVVPIAAPTGEELQHHYLWRFWRHLPRRGHLTIFDRSWYGRVLVERVEGFATAEQWQRAYEEINHFEEQLAEHGPILKFWLHIDKDEQMRRFKRREQIPHKRHKITDEDYRNREKWNAYELAVNEMIARTSTSEAPWHLVPANDKRHARVEVIKAYCKAMKKWL